jgi:hypothetical protein
MVAFSAKIGEIWKSVTDEPIEFEKLSVEAQDCRKITNHSRGIHTIGSDLIKENGRM